MNSYTVQFTVQQIRFFAFIKNDYIKKLYCKSIAVI